MNCLQNLPRCSVSPLLGFGGNQRDLSSSFLKMLPIKANDPKSRLVLQAVSDSKSSSEISGVAKEEEKSDEYSQDMTQAMGAVLTYRHELGMNYNFIRPDLIVGSCLQTPEDVDKLREIGVKTIFCLQQDPDLEYFGVDISSIQAYAKKYSDIQHIRCEIRDFDAFDLRMRLPAVVSTLYKAVKRNGGVTYVHCTAGMGRAPAVALTYMFWVQGYKLMEAHKLLMSKRSCFPKLDAIRNATIDILTGLKKKTVTLTLKDKGFSTVEISGLDIGWGQRIPLTLDKGTGFWILKRELPEGQFEYKYIIDGEWTHNEAEPFMGPNKDGHTNNYTKVVDDPTSVDGATRERLSSEDPELLEEERLKLIQFLETCSEAELTGLKRKTVTLTLKDKGFSTVEISGLDIGWGQRIPLTLDKGTGFWILKRELPEGQFEYKYIIDGEWTHNEAEPFMGPNKDGHTNNYTKVVDDPKSVDGATRERLSSEDPELLEEERLKLIQFLETCSEAEV